MLWMWIHFLPGWWWFFVIWTQSPWKVGWRQSSELWDCKHQPESDLARRVTLIICNKHTMDGLIENNGSNMPNMYLLLNTWEKIGGSQTNAAKIEMRREGGERGGVGGGGGEARAQSRWPSHPDAAENPAKQIMSRLDYLGDPDYSGASSSGSAPGCLCRDQLFSLSFLPGRSCLAPARDQPERRQHAANAAPCDAIT